jgi:hypothetical protein
MRPGLVSRWRRLGRIEPTSNSARLQSVLQVWRSRMRWCKTEVLPLTWAPQLLRVIMYS